MTFSVYSPYFDTEQKYWYNKKLNKRDIPIDISDMFVEISKEYEHKPGKMAKNYFGDERLKWVFLVMNRDIFKNNDVINDFKSGITIRIPTKDRLMSLIS